MDPHCIFFFNFQQTRRGKCNAAPLSYNNNNISLDYAVVYLHIEQGGDIWSETVTRDASEVAFKYIKMHANVRYEEGLFLSLALLK